MEQRDPESGAAEEPTPAAAEPGDIELAAAAAVAEAEESDPADAGAEKTGWTAALSGLVGGADGHGPRRWAVVAAVAVTAVALATTAAAVSMHGSSNKHPAVAGVDQSQTVDQTATTPQSGLTTADTSSTPGTSDSSQSPTTSSAATPTTQTPSSTAKTPPTTSSKPGVPVGSNETDCQDTSHETPQDAAVKFSGMTKGAQAAFLAAQSAAKEAGIASFVLNSGYRSAAYQQRIYDCWVRQLGSPQAARQYALPPRESAHVAGYAMDIAPQSAATWLEGTAGKYGLCRRYVDEPWHFEYQSLYKTRGCPALLPQP